MTTAEKMLARAAGVSRLKAGGLAELARERYLAEAGG